MRGSSFKRHEILGEGFRIRTQKLRGQISQGLALPLAELNLDEDLPVDTDLTEALHVTLCEEYAAAGKQMDTEKLAEEIKKLDEIIE